LRARRALRRDPGAIGPDGLALPPDELMAQVSGIRDHSEFLAGGALGREVITAVLARNGVRVAELGAMLDFGVGCGRVARHWAGIDVDVHGCDYNPQLVEWCRRNLPHVTARANGLEPPLPYDDEQFDLVYALSVFTHLTEPQQRAWMAELRRVTRPGGLVLFTTHGPTFAFTDPAWPPPAIRRRLAAGELVVVLPEHAGRNACTALHPRSWVEEQMLSGLDLVEYREHGAAMNGGQDLYLARRAVAPRQATGAVPATPSDAR
jgi:SAM-dependent methyltransferase